MTSRPCRVWPNPTDNPELMDVVPEPGRKTKKKRINTNTCIQIHGLALRLDGWVGIQPKKRGDVKIPQLRSPSWS